MGILCPRKHLSRMVKMKPYSNKITVFQRLRTALLVMLLKKIKSIKRRKKKEADFQLFYSNIQHLRMSMHIHMIFKEIKYQ